MPACYYAINVNTPNECTALVRPHITRRQSFFSRIAAHPSTRLIPSIVLGATIWFGVTPTEDLSPTAIHLLAVFLSCIFALITTSVDISMLVLTSLTLLAVTRSFECVDRATGLSTECRLCGHVNPSTGDTYECKSATEAFQQSLEGFSSSVVWLIFAAFHLGKAVEVTGLGRRLSLLMITVFGRWTLGLAYAIVLSEMLLAAFVPSNTARGGGIVLPVVSSIASTLGSTPTSDPSLGRYLMLVGAHSNLISASMYLTGMAPNPIIVAKANELFSGLDFGFMTWLKGSLVPSLVCALLLPIVLRWLCGLENNAAKTSSDTIIKHARAELEHMGRISLKEMQLLLVLVACLTLWVTANYTKLDSTLVALLGVVALLHMGAITWKDISNNSHAWDTLFWLGGFVTIAQQLSEAGASAFLGNKISSTIVQSGLPAVPCLAIAYFATTFVFSSLSAHTLAFASTFLEAGHALGAHPRVLTGLLGYFGALGGCMTNFSTGMSAMYFAMGYVPRVQWFSIGIRLALFYLVVYFTIGMAWWKFLGWC